MSDHPAAARDVILGRIRAALRDERGGADVPRDYRTHGDLAPPAVVDLFVERVDDYHATVHRCDDDGLPALLAGRLTAAGTRRIVVPPSLPSRWLTALPDTVDVLPDDGGLLPAELDGCDAVVTAAAVGIAETGTLVLDGSPDQGRRALSLVPDHHLCVIASEQIEQTVPEALARLEPQRPLTLISGPSATSDIELDRVEGVHGPRTLEVVVVRPTAS